MIGAPIHLGGERLVLDPAGALVWPARGVLVVADLHLEKGSHFAARGQLLPPWDTRVTLDRLAGLLRRHAPRVVVALGDSFHDAGGAARLHAADAARLAAMARAHRIVWVRGNHDAMTEGPFGDWAEAWAEGGLVFRHQAVAASAGGEISGHFHPKATVPARGTTLTRPCFVVDGRRVLMPAFGAYTGGLDVRDPAIASLFPHGGRAFLLGRDRLFSFALAAAPRAAARRMVARGLAAGPPPDAVPDMS